ncbi:hypothetical protein FOL47_007392 [Perkinsus chesapeaki]|uniref:Major facilitator superfamily (MFS) profile domain-containing protein n=1 Tax=Perkinsus chesapeaki TaxID=330153 RepID=A0A7J6LL85_PERCH|nr:hypothetical protein FOL47_007392 [Perkinsus chesapeaki]
MDNSGPLSPQDYYSQSRLARLRYRLKYEPRRILDLSLIFISIFIEWLGNTLLAPITPWYIEKLAPDMDEGSAASILMASYAVGTFLASLFTGPLSDRIGRRPILIAAMFLYTSSQFAAANAWNITTFAIFRAIGGVSAGTRPVIMAYLTDTSRPDDMKLYGVLMGLFVVTGQALGPMLGGALASVTLSFPFYFLGGVSVVLLILLVIFLRESLVKDENGRPRSIWGAGQIAEPPNNKYLVPTVLCLATASFSGQYVFSSWTTVFGLLGADRYDLSSSSNGAVLGVQAIVVILVNLVYLPITHVLAPALVGCIGHLLCALLIIVPFIYNLYLTIALGMALNVGCGLYFAGMAYFNSVVAPPKQRGLINSLVMSMANLGGIFGPLIAGPLYDMDPIHRAYPFYLSAGISVVGGTACLGIHKALIYALSLVSQTGTRKVETNDDEMNHNHAP